jgi:hypothetical protein
MKRPLLFILVLLISFMSFSQEPEKKAETKTGWNFGVLPAISFDTDLGFQYGGLVNFFNYGDGTKYPDYLHNIYLEISRYTKGSAIYRLAYDSKYLIPGIRITSDLAYLPDQAYDFYGFNGYESKFNKNWIDDANTDGAYKTRMFYAYQNNLFRFKTDVQFPLVGDKLLALVGFNLQSFSVKDVDIAKLNKGKKSNLLPDTPTIYDNYVKWGIIPDRDKSGGFIPLLKAGLVFDTRDNEPNPMKGIWTEAFFFGAPVIGTKTGFIKFNITHRQYFTIIKRDLSFAYRISYQGKLYGEVPFYYQPQIETSLMKDQLGLGGSKTIRGIRRTRVIGDGIVYGNLELRWKPVHFNFIRQKFYIGLNGFCDFGQVVQKVAVSTKDNIDANTLIPVNEKADYFDFPGGEKLHISYGAGLRIAMNQNFVVSLDYGRAINPQDGESGMYIGLNYLF